MTARQEQKFRKRAKVKRLYYALCRYRGAMPLDNSILMQIKTEDMNELCKRKFESLSEKEKAGFVEGLGIG